MKERRAASGWFGRPALSGAAVLSAIAAAAAPLDQAFVERWYSAGVYPRMQHVLTPASNVLPIALLDVLVIAATWWLMRRWWHALRRGAEPRWTRVRATAIATISAAAVTYLLFLLLWGLNYRRLPLLERLVVDSTPPSTEQVVRLARDVVGRLNDGYDPAHAAGWEAPPWRRDALRAAFADVQRQLADAPPAVPGRLKRTLFGPFFRWTGVDGMVNPFGLEVLGNPDLLPYERPFVAAHEWAHLAGYADESEANFIGWLTSIHGDPPSRYSGWLYLYWQVAGELSAAERAEIARGLRDGPRRDLEGIAARLRRGDFPALRRASWMVYDSYLKANRVEAGVRSYGAVVSLILRARFESGWRPVRRLAPGSAPTRVPSSVPTRAPSRAPTPAQSPPSR